MINITSLRHKVALDNNIGTVGERLMLQVFQNVIVLFG